MTPNRKPYVCPVLLALMLAAVLMILVACAGNPGASFPRPP